MDSDNITLLGLLKRAVAERNIITVRVTGSCMEPSIREGDYICVKKEDCLQVGDTVLYCPFPFNSFYLHRIIEIREEGRFYVCKGDSSPTIDPPIPEEQIIGKAVGHVTPHPVPALVDTSSCVVVSPDVFYELQEDRVLVFHAAHGKILLWNPSILRVLRKAQSSITVSEILREVPDQKREKVFSVITRLVSEGILCVV